MMNVLVSLENALNNRMLGSPRRWLGHHWLALLTPAVVVGVLLLSAALPMRVAPSRLKAFLFLLPAAGALVAIVHWPPLGLVALIITALIVPSPSLPGGFNLAVLLLILLIGLWWLDMILGRRKMRLLPSRTVAPLLTLIGTSVLAFGVGQLRWFTLVQSAPMDAQVGGLVIFILAAGAFLLVAHQVRDLRWLEVMTWVFLALGALHIAGWLVPWVGGIQDRLFQPGTTNNSMFWTWLVALAFSQALYNRKLHMGWRLALGVLVLATMFVAIAWNSDWKSGYLPPLVAIAAIIGFRDWRLGLLVGLAAIVPAMDIGTEAIATDQYSYSTRLDAWQIVLDMAKVNPITGFGPANYSWYTPLFPIRGYAIQFNSHNQYVDIVAQIGLLGLACFLWFAWETGWLGWKLRRRASPGFAQAYVYGALGGWVATLASGMLVDWFLPYVYNIGLTGFRASMLAWLFPGGLLSIEQIVRRQSQAESENETQ
jgi:O-antigen ligase